MRTLRNSDNCSQILSYQPFLSWITLIYFADKSGKVTRLGFFAMRFMLDAAFRWLPGVLLVTPSMQHDHACFAQKLQAMCHKLHMIKGRNNMHGILRLRSTLWLRHDYKTRRLHAQQLYRNILIHMSTSIFLISRKGALLVSWRRWPGMLFQLFTGKYSHPFQGNRLSLSRRLASFVVFFSWFFAIASRRQPLLSVTCSTMGDENARK